MWDSHQMLKSGYRKGGAKTIHWRTNKERKKGEERERKYTEIHIHKMIFYIISALSSEKKGIFSFTQDIVHWVGRAKVVFVCLFLCSIC